MSTSAPERVVQQHELAPFPDGGPIIDEGADIGWRVEQGDLFVTLRREALAPDPLVLQAFINRVLRPCPVYGAVLSSDEEMTRSSFDHVYRLPTLATMDEFQSNILAGLPAAGLRIVQTEDIDHTAMDKYLNQVTGVITPRGVPASLDPKLFVHDFLGHGPGASIAHEQPIAAFGALYSLADELTGNVRREYIKGLSDGFEVFSGHCVSEVADQVAQYHFGNLVGRSLTYIAAYCPPEIFALARQKAANSGMGQVVEFPRHRTPSYEVTWELENLRLYYAQVNERLQQQPAEWMLRTNSGEAA